MVSAHRLVLGAFLFLSGVAGLIYEVVWARYLGLFIGHGTAAEVAVLTVFMCGLTLGSAWLGKLADRVGSPLALYAGLEMAIGVYGLIFPALMTGIGGATTLLCHTLGWSNGSPLWFRFVVSGASLLLPTVLMGGTLPAAVRALTPAVAEVRSNLGWLYGLNTLGAVVGTLIGGLVLVGRWGLDLTIDFAAALNVLVGIGGLAVARIRSALVSNVQGPNVQIEEKPRPRVGRADLAEGDPHVIGPVLIAAMLWGAAGLIYELGWIRVLVLALGSSAYSFTLVVASFILGISIGAALAGRLTDEARLRTYLAVIQVGTALLASAGFLAGQLLPFALHVVSVAIARTPAGYVLSQVISFIFSGILVVPGTVALGMGLPVASRLVARVDNQIGAAVGRLFAWNTVGTLLGSLAGGVVLMPWLGIKGMFFVAGGLNLAAALLLSVRPLARRALLFAGVSGCVLFFVGLAVPWNERLLTRGLFRLVPNATAMSLKELWRLAENDQLIYRRHGRVATVTVAEGPTHGRTLQVNGKADASDGPDDMKTQELIGQLPMLLQSSAKDVLLIGLGSGTTAAAIASHPGVSLDVVEISPEVVEASRYFDHINDRIYDNASVRLIVEDAKSFLPATDKRYDVIVSEPSNPWVSGVGGLFTEEYFRLAAGRLRDNGLMVQWFHEYESSDDIVRMILRTYGAVFPHFLVWGVDRDVILVGSPRPLSISLESFRQRLQAEAVQARLQRAGIYGAAGLLVLQRFSEAGAAALISAGPTNSDFFPNLEFMAPKAFFLGQDATLLRSADERLRPYSAKRLLLGEYAEKHPLSPSDYLDMARTMAGSRSIPPSFYADLLTRCLDAPLTRTQCASFLTVHCLHQMDLHGAAVAADALPRGSEEEVGARKMIALQAFDKLVARTLHPEKEEAKDVQAEIERALALQPSPRMYEILGRLRLSAGDALEALAAFEAGEKVLGTHGSENQRAEFFMYYAQALLESGRIDSAARILGRTELLVPDSDWVRMLRAELVSAGAK